MDKLPKEILETIFFNLNCKSLILVNRTCKNFNIENILNKKKHDGFPRKEGKCILHQIQDQSLLNMMTNPNINSIMSNYIYDTNMDVGRGDFVIISKPCHTQYERSDNDYKLRIFDGLKLIDLENDGRQRENILLPRQFNVIENNVPIKYWVNDQLCKWTIFDVYSVWFDHSSVRDQCLNNIKYDLLFDDPTKYSVYTHFKYKNNDYYIICDYLMYDGNEWGENINTINLKIENDDTKLYIMNKFRKKLNNDNIKFSANELFTNNENSLVIGI
jgi:hypothetical protein